MHKMLTLVLSWMIGAFALVQQAKGEEPSAEVDDAAPPGTRFFDQAPALLDFSQAFLRDWQKSHPGPIKDGGDYDALLWLQRILAAYGRKVDLASPASEEFNGFFGLNEAREAGMAYFANDALTVMLDVDYGHQYMAYMAVRFDRKKRQILYSGLSGYINWDHPLDEMDPSHGLAALYDVMENTLNILDLRDFSRCMVALDEEPEEMTIAEGQVLVTTGSRVTAVAPKSCKLKPTA